LGQSTATQYCAFGGYHIYRTGGSGATEFSPSTFNLNFSDTSVQPSTKYSYQVSAYDTSGHESALSTPPLTVTTAQANACSSSNSQPTTPTLTQGDASYTPLI